MGVVRTGETEQDQELAKWEKPYRYEPFPAMMYRGVLRSDGIHDFDTLIVQGERDHKAKLADGWVDSPLLAKQQIERQQQDIALAAAENAAAATKMTGKAKRELQAREAATYKHVAE